MDGHQRPVAGAPGADRAQTTALHQDRPGASRGRGCPGPGGEHRADLPTSGRATRGEGAARVSAVVEHEAADGVEALLSAYQALGPEARAELRRRLLLRAPDDERARTLAGSIAESEAARQAERVRAGDDDFSLPSDELLHYLGLVRSALLAYVPTDRYRPGDEDRIDLLREETMLALEPLERTLKAYFRYEVKGLEHVPQRGRAIIVSNHGVLPIDGWFLYYEIRRAHGRWPRGLTDWRIFRLPYLRQLFLDLGTVVGSHENAERLLRDEQLVFIMPGGSKEAWKSSRYRYRLLWQGRFGFVKLALRTGAPIIPSANVGTDDTYRVFFDGYTTAYKLFRSKRVLFPISLPVGLGPLPLPAKMTQYVGEPIRLPYPPEAAEDPAIVQACQELVKSKVYALIDRGLREREERRLAAVGGP
jgi:1-acyl-sn-glycerol-3-phosphate acyltransferase